MFCIKCGSPLVDGARFCITCGAVTKNDGTAPVQPADPAAQTVSPPVETIPVPLAQPAPAPPTETAPVTPAEPFGTAPAQAAMPTAEPFGAPSAQTAYVLPDGGLHAPGPSGAYPAPAYSSAPAKKRLPGWAIALIIVGIALVVLTVGSVLGIKYIGNLVNGRNSSSADSRSASVSDSVSGSNSTSADVSDSGSDPDSWMPATGTDIIRGNGFIDAEDAITAYLTALRRNDREGVCATMSPALIDLANRLDYTLDDILYELDEFEGFYGYAIKGYEILGYDEYTDESAESFEEKLEVDITEYGVYYVWVDFGDTDVFEMNIDVIKVDGRWGIAEMWYGELD